MSTDEAWDRAMAQVAHHHPACRKRMYDPQSSPCTCAREFTQEVNELKVVLKAIAEQCDVQKLHHLNPIRLLVNYSETVGSKEKREPIEDDIHGCSDIHD